MLEQAYYIMYGQFLSYATIMAQINNCAIDTNLVKQITEIPYTAQNLTYDTSGGQLAAEFDLFVQDSAPSLLYSQSCIYLFYDTTIFGKNIVDSGRINATKQGNRV